MKKRALVLSGGGTKGVYQCGAVSALKKLGKDNWDIITGTSVGALNAALLVQGDFDAMEAIYDNLEAEHVVNGYVPRDLSLPGLIRDHKNVLPVLGDYLKNEGLNISPFLDLLDRYFDPDRFLASPVDYGCMVTRKQGNVPVPVTKDMMRENAKDWLVASASAYPAFPVKVIDGEEYVDGGYADNSPIDLAMRLGAEEVTAVEMHEKVLHPGYLGREHITIIHPQHELFSLLEFDKVKMIRAKTLGYLDTMKTFQILSGIRYAFRPFPLPEEYDRWYLQVMRLEAMAYRLGGKWTSQEPVMETLRHFTHRVRLDYKEMFFATLDVLMTIAGMDDTVVWEFDKAREQLTAFFSREDADTAGVWSDVKALAGREETIRYLLSLVRKTEEEDGQDDITARAVMYPFVTALADFYLSMIRL